MGKTSGVSRLLVVGAIVAAGLGLAASPAAAVPALTVTPATGLLDQQIVTVTGSGFEPGDWLIIAQCPGAGLTGCDLNPPINTTGARVEVFSDGTLHATIRLSRDLGDVSCADGDCAVVAVTVATPRTERARTPVDFAATGTAPPPPDATLSIAAADMRADGAAAVVTTWAGSGYLPWFRAVPFVGATVPISAVSNGGGVPGAYVSICTSPPSGWAGCERLIGWGTIAPLPVIQPVHETMVIAPDGTISSFQRALPRMVDSLEGRVDCAVEDCSFALEQDGSPHSNVADVAWAPEWSPWPSARAFVVEAYANLVGRAPTAGERSAAVAGLIDRSLTGYTFLRQLAGRPDGLRLAELTRLYQAALDRRPDADGLLYWASELRRTGSITAVAGAFGRTREFRQAFGPSVGDTTAVTRAYQRTLGRSPSSAETGYWVGRLEAGMSRTHLIHLFSRTPEFLAGQAPRSEATAVIVTLLHRSPTQEEWSLSARWRESISEWADEVVLRVLSSDELIADVG